MTIQALKTATATAQAVLQPVGVAAILLTTLGLITLTGLAFGGVVPWPEFSVSYAGAEYQAGMIAQIALTGLMVVLCTYLPGTMRVQRLETTHRRFHINMEDVTRAYHAAHAADSAGKFQTRHEFDAVRERIAYLRDHPDLEGLEPQILEIAAQMSQVSQDLADTYSDEKMERARSFLRQRQEEVARFEQRLEQARAAVLEISHWARQVEMEESVARSQLDRLQDELRDVMPELLPAAARTNPAQDRIIDLSTRAVANRIPGE